MNHTITLHFDDNLNDGDLRYIAQKVPRDLDADCKGCVAPGLCPDWDKVWDWAAEAYGSAEVVEFFWDNISECFGPIWLDAYTNHRQSPLEALAEAAE